MAPAREALLFDAMRALARRDWPAALEGARTVLRDHDAADLDALFICGVALGATGEADAARKALRQVLERRPDHHDAWYNLGVMHGQRGQPAAAAACYQAALRSDPNNHAILHQLARMLEEVGRREAALDAYRAAARHSPNPGGAWHYTGTDHTADAEAAIRRLTS